MSGHRLPLLCIGEPDAGKTTLAWQLEAQWAQRIGKLVLDHRPRDLQVLVQAGAKLSQGLPVEHTAANTAAKIEFDIRTPDGRRVMLVFPEYGGERLRDIVRTRRLQSWWLERLRTSPAWLLLLRPTTLRRHTDLLERLHRPPTDVKVEPPGPSEWDGAAYWTELLQILLDGAERSVVTRLSSPRLAVALSCWDELGEPVGRLPSDVLLERAPLLSEFITSNWAPDALTIWGLSPQGRPLKKGIPDLDYVDRDPATQGFAITPRGERVPNLDEPLAWLLSGAA